MENLPIFWENLENSRWPQFLYNIYDQEKYYQDKPFNIYIQSLINIIEENNRVITAKKGKVKLALFYGNV